MTLRAVVIGCGNIGTRYDHHDDGRPWPLTHAGAYSAHPAFELVGVADVDAERLGACQRRWRMPHAAADFHDLLAATRPDVVSIATPPSVRRTVVEAALAHGVRAVLCEKPLATTLADGEEIVVRCAAAGVTLAVNYIRRWEPGCRTVSELLQKGELGPLQRIAGLYVRGLANNGGHLIDLIRWWTGDVVAVDQVRERVAGSPDVTLVGRDGTPCEIRALAGDAYDVFELDVFGREGQVSLRDFGQSLSIRRAMRDPKFEALTVLDRPVAIPTSLDQAMYRVVDDLAASVLTGAAPACTGEDGLSVLRVVTMVEARQRV